MAKPDKQRRKAMLNQWKEQQRSAARAALPLPDADLRDLFDALDAALANEDCDHSRRLTRAFLESRGLPIEPVFAWLDENGGFCDCEVLANVEEHWQSCRGES